MFAETDLASFLNVKLGDNIVWSWYTELLFGVWGRGGALEIRQVYCTVLLAGCGEQPAR